MNDQWYYQSLGFEFGPVTLADLIQKLHDGELSAGDLVREGEAGAWVTAANVQARLQPAGAVRSMGSNSALGRAGTHQLDEFSDLSELTVVSEAAAPPPRRASHAAAEQSWYFQTFGNEFGPVSFDELSRMVAAAELSRDDLIRPGTDGRWAAAETFDGLFPADATHVESNEDFVTQQAALLDEFSLQPAARHEEPAARAPAAFEPAEIPAEVTVGGEAGRDWYCFMIGREFGPLTLAELRGLVAEGRLAANDPVRWGTEGEWRSASAIEALFFAPPALSDTMVESPTAVSAPRSRAAAPPSGPAPVPLAEPEADPAKPSDQDRTLAWLEKHCPTPDSVAAQATTAQPVPPAAPGAAAAKGAAPAKPVEASRAAATNILRSMSADVVRKPTAQAKGASRPAASGPSLGEQLGQIPPKYLAIGGAAAAIVLFFWFGGMSLIPGMGYGSVYDSLQSVQSQVVAARQEHSAVSQTVKASLKEILKKLPRPSRVSGKSPYASLKQAHKYLNEMADSTGMPPPPSGGEDPYVRAEKNYQESMQRAAKLLGKK